MAHLEILEESVSFPFELAPGTASYSGVPDSVLELSAHVKPWHLVGWHDETSNTIGLAKKHQSVVVDRAGITSLSVSFMRPAKGRGWVSLEAKSKEGIATVVLLQTLIYSNEALEWLQAKQKMLESLFGYPLAFDDYGSDY